MTYLGGQSMQLFEQFGFDVVGTYDTHTCGVFRCKTPLQSATVMWPVAEDFTIRLGAKKAVAQPGQETWFDYMRLLIEANGQWVSNHEIANVCCKNEMVSAGAVRTLAVRVKEWLKVNKMPELASAIQGQGRKTRIVRSMLPRENVGVPSDAFEDLLAALIAKPFVQ